MAAPFWKVKCADCSNEQVVFSRPATPVNCQVCGTALLALTGGQATPKGELVAVLE